MSKDREGKRDGEREEEERGSHLHVVPLRMWMQKHVCTLVTLLLPAMLKVGMCLSQQLGDSIIINCPSV